MGEFKITKALVEAFQPPPPRAEKGLAYRTVGLGKSRGLMICSCCRSVVVVVVVAAAMPDLRRRQNRGGGCYMATSFLAEAAESLDSSSNLCVVSVGKKEPLRNGGAMVLVEILLLGSSS